MSDQNDAGHDPLREQAKRNLTFRLSDSSAVQDALIDEEVKREKTSFREGIEPKKRAGN